MSQNKKYVIHWRSKITGYEGHGSPLTKTVAEDSLKLVTLKYKKEFDHWIEEVPEG